MAPRLLPVVLGALLLLVVLVGLEYPLAWAWPGYPPPLALWVRLLVVLVVGGVWGRRRGAH